MLDSDFLPGFQKTPTAFLLSYLMLHCRVSSFLPSLPCRGGDSEWREGRGGTWRKPDVSVMTEPWTVIAIMQSIEHRQHVNIYAYRCFPMEEKMSSGTDRRVCVGGEGVDDGPACSGQDLQ